jgi:hypothetical protein
VQHRRKTVQALLFPAFFSLAQGLSEKLRATEANLKNTNVKAEA